MTVTDKEIDRIVHHAKHWGFEEAAAALEQLKIDRAFLREENNQLRLRLEALQAALDTGPAPEQMR